MSYLSKQRKGVDFAGRVAYPVKFLWYVHYSFNTEIIRAITTKDIFNRFSLTDFHFMILLIKWC